jgi:hypothetical protein
VLPRRHIEAYLSFLLRHRLGVLLALGGITAGFVYALATRMSVSTNFFELYPPRHPYIQLYTKYRELFGSANTVRIVLERRRGTIFDDPETLRKVDRITLGLLHDVPGVNGEQLFSITHPRLKTALASSSGVKVVPLSDPRLPQDRDELALFRQKVHATEGVRGFFVSPDETATQIVAGVWEDQSDLLGLWKRIQAMVAREEDHDHRIYVTGLPILYGYFLEAVPQLGWVIGASVLTMGTILWFQFRSAHGVWIPLCSGALSALWGLGFAALAGLSLDPLVLVIPLLISARAHSHSVQSLERYHEEYRRLGDPREAIVKSYTALFGPATVSILSDSIAIFTLVVAGIPAIQEIAVLSAFWIGSIFASVVTLHPVVLSFTQPTPPVAAAPGMLSRLSGRLVDGLWWLSTGRRPKAMAASLALLLGVGLWGSAKLRVGNAPLGEALLDSGHPYNVAFRKANEKFVGASDLVIVAEGKKEGALRSAETLYGLELFARHMEKGGASGSLTAASLLKKIFRTFHEGDPKWSMLPDDDEHVGQLWFLAASNSRRGELDTFADPTFTHGAIRLFYRDYDRETIRQAIARAKEYIESVARPDDAVRYRLAGGLLGVLAAVNEEVERSYRVNLALILGTVFVLSYWTYRSLIGAAIVMLPSLVAQPLSETAMYLLGIDMNIASLPVAAVGIGIGIDYGYYILSRIVEESELDDTGETFEQAVRRALQSTGKTVLWTGLSLTASVAYWMFFPMKFQAEMALLLALILGFHLVGALLFIPPMASWLRPWFARAVAEERRVEICAAGAGERRRGRGAS